jgi:hypothetical protein
MNELAERVPMEQKVKVKSLLKILNHVNDKFFEILERESQSSSTNVKTAF